MDALRGVNVDPMTYFDWNVKAQFPGAIAGDIIQTPVIDLLAVNPLCNRLVFHKQIVGAASNDNIKVLVSADNVNWFQAPLFNGGTGGAVANVTISATEAAVTALPSLRYVRCQLTLATAVTGMTQLNTALALMRF
jgi:hypothetical protein